MILPKDLTSPWSFRQLNRMTRGLRWGSWHGGPTGTKNGMRLNATRKQGWRIVLIAQGIFQVRRTWSVRLRSSSTRIIVAEAPKRANEFREKSGNPPALD